jgi:hypothetical protein
MRDGEAGLSTRRFWRRSFATAELPVETVEAIARTRMHPRYNHLNALLDQDEQHAGAPSARSPNGPSKL